MAWERSPADLRGGLALEKAKLVMKTIRYWQRLAFAMPIRPEGIPLGKDSFGKASLPQRSQGLLWRMPLAWGGHPLGNLRSKYNQIGEKVQCWLQTILRILNTEMASAQGKNQNFGCQPFKLAF